MERPTMDSSSSMPLPSEQDVLSDLAALKPQASDGTSAAAAITLSQGAQIGWEGAQRKLLRRRDPEFPPLLSAIGQEIEGEARITVAASGAVVRVEITRSSGYIEIDASVEAALRDYLFSRADGRENAIGTVRFRFRLEKLD
jgi:TonB family protein